MIISTIINNKEINSGVTNINKDTVIINNIRKLINRTNNFLFPNKILFQEIEGICKQKCFRADLNL
jgi:hypothetical protein